MTKLFQPLRIFRGTFAKSDDVVAYHNVDKKRPYCEEEHWNKFDIAKRQIDDLQQRERCRTKLFKLRDIA
ncbi:hypothetical protein J2W97_002929 [Paenibacillus jamilae]|uniref:hypothetical protein n=1 Tax=Paenibacillus polymyxa TaxID=1406 RepID=UPI00295A1FFC|nr:hypothetical protein [Paenibacillus polymyxa]MDP9676934.1 hypothetical protein [Paenibacillus jamilae]MDY8025410.1 hypothetical protein [Paenibacillus polymyxa]